MARNFGLHPRYPCMVWKKDHWEVKEPDESWFWPAFVIVVSGSLFAGALFIFSLLTEQVSPL